jgi:hypothetical protein
MYTANQKNLPDYLMIYDSNMILYQINMTMNKIKIKLINQSNVM